MDKNIIKQYGKSEVSQKLNIFWDISTQCNFKCTYCYAERLNDWNKIDKWPRQQLILNIIKMSKLPVNLHIIGGEPTIHPKYNEIVKQSIDIVNKQDGNYVCIVSNGSKPEKFYRNHIYDKSIILAFSYHLEYEKQLGKDFCKLLKNISIAVERGFKVAIHFMIPLDPRDYKAAHTFLDNIEKISKDILIRSYYLQKTKNGKEVFCDYPKGVYNEFSRLDKMTGEFILEYENGSKTSFNYYSLFDKSRFSFKGWKCWNNMYEISWDGYVVKSCFEDVTRKSIYTDIGYFKNIKTVCAVTCPHTVCEAQPYFNRHKEKEIV